MSATFPDGQEWIVDQVRDVRGVGRILHFVFPNGKTRSVNIGDTPDTDTFRAEIADAIRHERRYIAGARIEAPPS